MQKSKLKSKSKYYISTPLIDSKESKKNPSTNDIATVKGLIEEKKKKNTPPRITINVLSDDDDDDGDKKDLIKSDKTGDETEDEDSTANESEISKPSFTGLLWKKVQLKAELVAMRESLKEQKKIILGSENFDSHAKIDSWNTMLKRYIGYISETKAKIRSIDIALRSEGSKTESNDDKDDDDDSDPFVQLCIGEFLTDIRDLKNEYLKPEGTEIKSESKEAKKPEPEPEPEGGDETESEHYGGDEPEFEPESEHERGDETESEPEPEPEDETEKEDYDLEENEDDKPDLASVVEVTSEAKLREEEYKEAEGLAKTLGVSISETTAFMDSKSRVKCRDDLFKSKGMKCPIFINCQDKSYIESQRCISEMATVYDKLDKKIADEVFQSSLDRAFEKRDKSIIAVKTGDLCSICLKSQVVDQEEEGEIDLDLVCNGQLIRESKLAIEKQKGTKVIEEGFVCKRTWHRRCFLEKYKHNYKKDFIKSIFEDENWKCQYCDEYDRMVESRRKTNATKKRKAAEDGRESNKKQKGVDKKINELLSATLGRVPTEGEKKSIKNALNSTTEEKDVNSKVVAGPSSPIKDVVVIPKPQSIVEGKHEFK